VELARAGDDEWLLSVATNNLGNLHLQEGDYERAIALFEESLAIGEARGDLDRRAPALVTSASRPTDSVISHALTSSSDSGSPPARRSAWSNPSSTPCSVSPPARPGTTPSRGALLGYRAAGSRLRVPADDDAVEQPLRFWCRSRANRLEDGCRRRGLSHDDAISLALATG
jgi:hypothetical protein